MIKKIIIPIFLIFLLNSCVSQSKNCDIFDFIERVNKISNNIIIESDDIIVSEENVLYWIPENNTCVSFYINDKTGNIKKCNISYINKNQELFNMIKKAITYNNEYIIEEFFKIDERFLISYSDSRYADLKKEITLKKEINQQNLY